MQIRKRTDKQNETARRFMKCGHEPTLDPCCESEPESMVWGSQYADTNMVMTGALESCGIACARITALIDHL